MWISGSNWSACIVRVTMSHPSEPSSPTATIDKKLYTYRHGTRLRRHLIPDSYNYSFPMHMPLAARVSEQPQLQGSDCKVPTWKHGRWFNDTERMLLLRRRLGLIETVRAQNVKRFHSRDAELKVFYFHGTMITQTRSNHCSWWDDPHSQQLSNSEHVKYTQQRCHVQNQQRNALVSHIIIKQIGTLVRIPYLLRQVLLEYETAH